MLTTLRICIHGRFFLFACLAVSLLVTHNAARGQDGRARPATDLIVDGQVERVYQADGLVLVQLMVQRSEATHIDVGTRFPAPGEFVYIHAPQEGVVLDRDRSIDPLRIPKPQANIRAFLTAEQGGRWQGDGKEWYQENTQGSGQSSTLGIVSQPTTSGRDVVLKVIQVTPDSPAAKAGIEPGDLLVEANRVVVQSQQQLDDAYRKNPGKFALTVRDIRTGRDVLVEVDATAISNPSSINRKSLGVTSALAFFEGEAVVKVTAVKPGSPAQLAGITVGMLILKANNTPVDSPDALTGAEQNSRGRLTLQVVDPNATERRERTVQVAL